MNKQQFVKTLFLLFSGLIGNSSIWGQAIYGLQKVTSVEDKGLYVFVIHDRALINRCNGNELLTTGTYYISNLSGTEDYVWKLEKTGSNYRLKNVSVSKYLNAGSNSTDVYFDSSASSSWSFAFTDGVALIQLVGGTVRSLSDTGTFTNPGNTCKVYAKTNWEKGYHEFTVYQLVSSIPASVSSIEYATFSSEYALDFSGEPGLTVYTAAVNETKTKVMLREVTSKRVPANTAVVLHGAAGSYTGCIIADADAITGNDLQIASEAMTGNGKIYVLNRVDGVVGFYKLKSSGTLAKGKAYITLEGNTGAPMLSMSEDSEVTAIEMLPTDACQYQKGYYTLDGRLVERPTKGVYVVDGRKIVVK